MFQENSPVSTVTVTTTDPLEDRFGAGCRLPRGLREEAAGMSWSLFTAIYCPTPDIRVTSLDSEKLRAGRFCFTGEVVEYSKTRAPESRIAKLEATGAISALTHMLAESGRCVEIRAFHQKRLFEATVTLIEVAHQNDHRNTAWAVGFGPTPDASAAAAMASGAHRIHG